MAFAYTGFTWSMFISYVIQFYFGWQSAFVVDPILALIAFTAVYNNPSDVNYEYMNTALYWMLAAGFVFEGFENFPFCWPNSIL